MMEEAPLFIRIVLNDKHKLQINYQVRRHVIINLTDKSHEENVPEGRKYSFDPFMYKVI